ncbi:MAG: hypothetical protein ACHQ1H_06695, partial [Nitrososphaerales archaeon]
SVSFIPHSYSSGSITISIDRSSYTGTETIIVSGTVSPAPGASGTFVAVSITSPSGGTVDANQFVVGSSTGKYNGTFRTGGPSYSVSGTYTISANYNGATASILFHYSVSPKVTLQINRTHFSETQRIFVSGLISPAPRLKGTYVAVSISGPKGQTVDANQFLVLANYGTFKGSFVTGGPVYTLSGTYTITANYNGATASVTFSYSA